MTESFRKRGGWWVVAQFGMMAAVLIIAPSFPGRWSNALTIVLSTLLFVLGAATGIAGARGLGRCRTPFPAPMENSMLVTVGIYARIRHALYTSLMALSFAWALWWASLVGLVAAGALAVLLDLKSRWEERRLIERFPDYAGYRRRVKRFVPGIY